MTREQNPRRTLAILLTFFGCGVGHYYYGLKRRAILWFASMSALAFLLAAALPGVGRAVGFETAFVALMLALIVGVVAPMIDLARIPSEKSSHVPMFHVFLFWIAIGIVGGFLRFGIREYFLEAFKIPSGGMIPTLLVGDHLMADKGVYRRRDPDRGEAIVFGFPEKPEQDFVQRVIATQGDELEVKSGRPWINGWEVPHCKVGAATFPAAGESRSQHGELDVEFLDGHAYLTFHDEGSAFADTQGPFTAKEGEFWALGDNRNNSYDSRMWFGGLGGGVPRDLVKGQALFTWLSVGEDGVDGSRTGMSLSEPQLPRALQSLTADFDRCMQARPPYEKTVPPKR